MAQLAPLYCVAIDVPWGGVGMTDPERPEPRNRLPKSTLRTLVLALSVLVFVGHFLGELPPALDFVYGALTGVLIVGAAALALREKSDRRTA